jgi:nitrous oxidase accessory protein NosD
MRIPSRTGNTFSHNVAGAAIMYSRGIVMRRNNSSTTGRFLRHPFRIVMA